MKYLVTNRPEQYLSFINKTLQFGDLDLFMDWVSFESEGFQLDTETTMVKDSADAHQDRELILIQIGSLDGKVQWLIEWTVFEDPGWVKCLKILFERRDVYFILHNSKFDYIVIKSNLGITLENMHDTFLMSKILNTGLDLPKGYHSLAGCLKRFFEIDLDKEEQTTFTKDPFTYKQIEYASNDVTKLKLLFDKLKVLIDSWGLWYLYDKVEREVVKAYSDMELNPMRFDRIYWNKLVEELSIDDAKVEKELNEFVLQDPKLVEYLKVSKTVLKSNLIQPYDEFVANWGSNIFRKEVLIKLIPELDEIEKFTKPILKKFYKTDVLSAGKSRLLAWYLDRNYEKLNRYLKIWYKEWLLSKGYFIEEGTININWASSLQKLYIFQFYYPKLENTDAKALAKIHVNPLINKFKEYSKAHKYLTTYGENFQTKYVKRDGTISPSGLSQILNTGRVAFGILLQMPGQARFRNGFLPPSEDDVFVDSDYRSAEVLIMACAANEQTFINAVKQGKDLHMMSASLIFADKWKTVAEEDCTNLIDGSQCKCKEHNKLRKFSKAITFGLA